MHLKLWSQRLLAGWIGRSVSASGAGGISRRPLTFERLEDRLLLSAPVINGNVATINGTNGNDIIIVNTQTGVVTINGEEHQLPEEVTTAHLDGLEGDDQLTVFGTEDAERVRVFPDWLRWSRTASVERPRPSSG